MLLLTRCDIHTLSLQNSISALLLSQLNHFFMCSPTCCVMFLIINFVPAFTVSASVINAFFTGGNDPWNNSVQPLALASLLARIPGSHPGYPGSIPGQGIKMSLHSTTHCCLTRSVPLGGAQVLTLALHGRRLDRASISQSGRSLSSFLGPQPHGCGTAFPQNIFPPHPRYQHKWDAFFPKQHAIFTYMKSVFLSLYLNWWVAHVFIPKLLEVYLGSHVPCRQLPGSRGRRDLNKDLESLPCPAVCSVLNRQQPVGVACEED